MTMNYAKVENGQLTQIGLPTTGVLKDGSTVSGYNFLPEDILREEGWLPLVENEPEYNPETEYLEHVGYDITDIEVRPIYEVKLKPTHEPPPPSLEDKVLDLESENAQLKQNLITTQSAVDFILMNMLPPL